MNSSRRLYKQPQYDIRIQIIHSSITSDVKQLRAPLRQCQYNFRGTDIYRETNTDIGVVGCKKYRGVLLRGVVCVPTALAKTSPSGARRSKIEKFDFGFESLVSKIAEG